MTDSRRLVLLVQLPIPPSGIQPVRGNIPLAAGCLKLFARRHGLEDRFRIEILPADEANRCGDEGLVQAIATREPWLVGFSCFLWNVERTLWLAERIKERRPQTLCVAGGPEATLDNRLLSDAPAIDYLVIGEGEQTFCELLAALDACGAAGPVEGVWTRAMAPSEFRPRTALSDLDAVASPYTAGILAPDEQGTMLLETARGCRHRCKFCYYPKSFAAQHFLSEAKIAECLDYALRRGVREVAILDPTLNQRDDFSDFLRLLARGNPQRSYCFSGELRAEGIDAQTAGLLKAANFSEVEIGLQSVDAEAQRLMGRRVQLDRFADGVHAILDAGICARVDLILGLPGDTVDSVRRGIDFLIDNRAYGEIQVFHLSILPGTAFRRDAGALGLDYQNRPPYGVLATPTLSLADMAMLMDEAQDAFGVDFDAIAPPQLELADDGRGPLPLLKVDLDRDGEPGESALGGRLPGLAFTLWLRAESFATRRREAAAWIGWVLRRNPHLTLQVVLEPTADLAGLEQAVPLAHEACHQTLSYLDRYYSLQPGALLGAKRLVVVLPATGREELGEARLEMLGEHALIAWRG